MEQLRVSVTSCWIRGESCLLYIHFHLHTERKRERESLRGIWKANCSAATSWEIVGHRWTISHFSTRPNPSEHFLCWALCHPPLTYSLLLWATRRAPGKLGLAPDLWRLINGPLCSTAASHRLLVWQSDRPEKDQHRAHTSSVQLFITNWKGRAQSRATDPIWRIDPALCTAVKWSNEADQMFPKFVGFISSVILLWDRTEH